MVLGGTAALAAAWVTLLPGCAGLGGPKVVTLGETELNALMGRQFPLRQRVLEIVDLEIARPVLRLLPERNRLAVDLKLSARDRLLASQRSGALSFDSALRFDPASQSVRLTQVQVQSLSLDGLPSGEALARVGRLVAEQQLENLAVYTLTPERLAQMQQWGVTPGAVTVTARGVEITLAPKAR